jgi:hypothetical protein
MPEDMAVMIAQAVEKAVQPLRDEDSQHEGEDCCPGSHKGHTFG